MCDPVTIAVTTAVVAGASQVMGFIGEQQAYKANVQSANLNYAQTDEALQQRRVQVDAQQSENTLQQTIDQAASEGRISNSASALGIGSATTAASLNAASFANARSGSIQDLNADNQRLQIGTDLKGAENARRGQIASKQKPSAVKLALDLGTTALGGYGNYSDLKKGS